MNASNKCQLSFVMPVYNEAKRLPKTLKQIHTFSEKLPGCEWIFAIEPSEDPSLQILADFCKDKKGFRYIYNEKHQGKGYAVQTGVLAASGKWVFFMDADLSTPLKEVLRFIDLTTQNPETKIWIGSRKLKESKINIQQSFFRQTIGKGLNSILRLLDLTHFSDTQCGFKLFHHSCIPPLFTSLKTRGFGFDIEVLARAKKLNISIEEVAIEWNHDATSSVHMFRDSLLVCKEVVLIYYSLKRDFK